MTEPILKVENLKVAYGRIEAVREVDLEIQPGEFVGIIGSNGAGKTSTLRAIAGVKAPAAGSVTFRGEAIGGMPSYAVVGAWHRAGAGRPDDLRGSDRRRQSDAGRLSAAGQAREGTE